jgi:hypothetical protein
VSKKPSTTHTIEVPGAELVAGLTAVLPHAGADDTLPVLAAVNFTVRDGQLMLAATDRYTLGTYRLVEVEGDVELDVVLPRRDATDLLARAKKCKHFPPPLTFDTAKGELTFTDFERTITYSLLDAEFVRWWAVLPERDDDKTVIGINPVMLARLAKATDAKKPEHVRMEIGAPNKIVRVEVGERFVGGIMPVRLPDAAPEVKPPVRFTEPDADVQKVVDAMNADPNIPGEVTGVKVGTESEAPVSSDEPEYPERVEVDGVVVAETRHVDLHPEEPAEDVAEDEEGAETTPDWCGSCKGFGVVRGVGSKAGQPYKTANGAATATTSVECPTCHGDKVVAA